MHYCGPQAKNSVFSSPRAAGEELSLFVTAGRRRRTRSFRHCGPQAKNSVFSSLRVAGEELGLFVIASRRQSNPLKSSQPLMELFQKLFTVFFEPIFINCRTNLFEHIIQEIQIMIACKNAAQYFLFLKKVS